MIARCMAAGLLIVAIGAARTADAETSELRLQRPLDLVALPLLVMEHEHLIERTAEAMGLGSVNVIWNAPGEGDPLASLAAGDSDLVAADLAPFLLAADATAGTAQEVRALGALAERGNLDGLQVRTATLEDVFLDLTGREYRA